LIEKNVRLGLGAMEAKALSELAGEGKTVFSLDELAKKTVSRAMARKMASDLVKKKWLERLNKGTYLILELAAGNKPQWTEDSFFIASKLAKPYYIGYLSMLHFYGWTEQIPTTITIATTKTTRPKKILGTKYEFVALATSSIPPAYSG
jgi:predicted transcriptional regulator of viral defense system